MASSNGWSMRNRSHVGAAAVCVAVLALLVVGVLFVFGADRGASAQPAPTDGSTPTNAKVGGGVPARALGRVDAEVFDTLQVQPEVAVIVSLPAPPALKAAPLNRQALRQQIAAIQDDVLSALLPSDFKLTYRYEAVPGFAGLLTASGAQKLATHPGVTAVGLDRRVFATLSESVPLINADDVHALGITGAGVVVAVLDTGIDTDHPQLSDDIVAEHCYLSGGGCPGGAHPAEDDEGHGTHVSGIITSPQGVAPDAGIIASKVLDSVGSGSLSDVLAALDHLIAAHPETRAVNMSLGDSQSHAPGTCDGLYPALTTAIVTLRTAGATSFVASGNEAYKSGTAFPACISAAVSVGAVYDANVGSQLWWSCYDLTTAADQVACFSNSDASLDLLAPGSVITSSSMGGGTISYSGTSMAAPHAAGVAALLLDDEPGLTSDQVEARLRDRGVAVTDPANGVTSCRVNALAAVQDSGPVCEPSGPTRPANDDFGDRLPIPSPPFTHGQSTVGATTEPGEPQPCGGIASTVWFEYTPPDDGVLVADTVGSSFDTVLAAYHGPPNLSSLVNDACNDDTYGLQSEISFPVTGGVTYYFQVGGYSGAAGSLILNVHTPLSNDDFADAIVIPEPLPYTNAQSTVGASAEPGEPIPPSDQGCSTSMDTTVWYVHTPSTSKTLTVDTFGSNYDTQIVVWSGTSIGALTFVGCNDDTAGLQSEVIFPADADTTYYFQVDGWGAATGNLVFNLRGETDSYTAVRIGSGSAPTCTVDTVPLEIATPLVSPPLLVGAATVDVAYDPAVVEPTGWAPGPGWDMAQCNLNYTSSSVRCTALSTAGRTGEALLADLTFHCIGQTGQSSPLDVQVVTLTDPNGNPLPWEDEDGVFSCGLCGDVNCSGPPLDAVDALFILQHVVGMRACSDLCPPPAGTLYCSGADVNADTVIDAVDALFVLQCVVGLRPCDFQCSGP